MTPNAPGLPGRWRGCRGRRSGTRRTAESDTRSGTGTCAARACSPSPRGRNSRRTTRSRKSSPDSLTTDTAFILIVGKHNFKTQVHFVSAVLIDLDLDDSRCIQTRQSSHAPSQELQTLVTRDSPSRDLISFSCSSLRKLLKVLMSEMHSPDPTETTRETLSITTNHKTGFPLRLTNKIP